MLKSVAGHLAKILGGKSQEPEDYIEEEIISKVQEGHEQGVIETNEATMIRNVLEFNDLEAQDVMTHRKNIIAIDATTSLSDALQFMLDDNHSRFPVYEEHLDNIIGVLYLKDAMRCHTRHKHGYDTWMIKDVPGLLRRAVFIPETRSLSDLITAMQSRKLQMVIVSDEYGQTAGLVAMEDILERIVGNIQDEYDNEEAFIEKTADGGYMMSGLTPLQEAFKVLEIQTEDTDFETLNGYLIYKLDKIPSEDDRSRIEAEGYSFQILSVANKIIERVKVEKLAEEQQNETIEEEK